jgi:AraC-like DNA-binding protein
MRVTAADQGGGGLAGDHGMACMSRFDACCFRAVGATYRCRMARRDPVVPRELFQRLCRARELIEERFTEPLSVAGLARHAGLSRFHFLRQFRRVFGTTPREQLVRVRLERARELLRRGATVTEACLGVGFSSLGSFSTLFRKRFGKPPSHFRRLALAHPPQDAMMPFCFLTVSGEGGAIPEKIARRRPPSSRARRDP